MTQALILLAVLLALAIAMGVIAVAYNLSYASKVIVQFRELANKFGLELTIPPRTMAGLYQRNPNVYGTYEGREMSIYPRGYGLDNTRQTDTAVRMMTRAPASLHLSLARKSLSGKLGQVGRLKEVPTGDQDFDKEFTLRSNNPGASAIIDDELRQLILTDWKTTTGFLSLHKRTLTYEEMGLPRTETERRHIELMVGVCLIIASRIDAWTQ